MCQCEYLEVSELRDALLLRFKGDHLFLDGEIAMAIGNLLDDLVERPNCRNVIIDFSGVASLCSLMLGLLVMFRKQVAAKGGRIFLCSLGPEVHAQLERTRLRALWEVRESAASACEEFA